MSKSAKIVSMWRVVIIKGTVKAFLVLLVLVIFSIKLDGFAESMLEWIWNFFYVALVTADLFLIGTVAEMKHI